jgi:hypothetical protein
LSVSNSYAQLSIKEFVVFGNTGVQIGASSAIVNGKTGSNTLVQTTGNASIGGNIHSKGQVLLANSNTVNGSVYVTNAVNPPATGPSFQMGSNAYLSSTADVVGRVVIGGGTINGPVTYSESYSGPEPVNGRTQAMPSLPSLPSLPAIQSPTYSGGQNITNTRSISPGTYGNMNLGGAQTITFSAPGVYIFNSIKNSGNFNKFVFNFPADGKFKIFVRDDVDLYKINISYTTNVQALSNLTNSDLAARIFMQVGGSGSTSATGVDAWSITNGASGNNQSTWLGTVWAPNGNINVGSGSSQSKIVGALWSGKKVMIQSGVSITYSMFIDCSPTVNAGTDKHIDCDNPTAILTGSVSGTNPQYSWSKVGGSINGASNTSSITVNQPGTYVLTGSSLDCSQPATDTVVVTSTPCVLPYYPPPSTGKVNNKIGSELTSLLQNFGNVLDDGKTLFIIVNGKVLIDVIVKQGNFATVKSMLFDQNGIYGMTDSISNGPNSLIITGLYPINKLNLFDSLPMRDLISFVRPSYPPVANSGVIQTQGDSAMRTNYVRNGFHLSGDSVKVGVISDSYNTISNSDIANGDLPGLTDDPVQVLLDYPYGARSDEGRAMLQIVHDVAPKAKLAFRTGFITAGDMARGIRDLADVNCNIIVDDITFITEPFFRPGVIANAIRDVSLRGVHYVTAAGNFGVKSYEGVFAPASTALPTGISGVAHDFGGGDIFQSDSVKGTSTQPGIYTLVLQWENDIYSLGNNSGATADLDAYAFDNLGNIIGFNRINIEGDPTEVLTFVATRNTIVNIMIVNATGNLPVRFKYVVFRGDLKVNEYNQGFSTVVGQANAPEAITVGAALYLNTPAYGVATPTRSSFSSVGGTTYLGSPAQKPDLVGPNGVNTSVNFGGPNSDFDNDGLPNFFGTSAAAPHVAGAVALLVEARRKFYRDTLPPAQIKNILKNSAIDMDVPGFDLYTGKGFIQVDSAVRTMANPTPYIGSVRLADSSLTLGAQPMQIIVSGSYLTSGTKVLLGTDTLQSVLTNSSEVTATVPVFSGTQDLYLYTKPKSTLLNDGGLSNAYVLNGVVKRNLTIKADNKTRKYGENEPTFTVTVLENGDTSSLTLADLGLTNLSITTNATASSNVGIYYIRPSKTFDSTGADATYLALYNFAFQDGALTIQKMPLTITPNNQSIIYGNALTNVTYNYQFGSSNIADQTQLLNTVKLFHQSYVPSNALAVVKDFASLGTSFTTTDLIGMNMMMSFQSLKNSRRFQVLDGKLVPATVSSFNLYYLVDIAAQSLLNYKVAPNSSPFVNTYATITSRAILNSDALVQGIAKVSVNGQLVQMVNGSLVQMVNSNNVSMAPIVNGQLVQLVNGELSPTSNGQLVQLVNGQLVQLVNGEFAAVPNGQLVQLVNGSLVQMVNGQLVQMVNGQLVQLVNGANVTVDVNGQLVQMVNGQLVQLVNGQLVQLVNGQLVQMVNGALSAIPNGSLVQLVNGQLVQMVNGQLVQLVNSSGISGTNSKTAVIADEMDIPAPQNGWLGAMVGVNMITGLDVGTQKLVPGVFINENFDVTYNTGTITIQNNPCLLTHSRFTNFGSTTTAPTSMWLNVEVKVSGQLNNDGDYLLFTGGSITFNNITSTPLVTNFQVPNGKIVADRYTTAPKTYFDLANYTWVTKVPVGYSTTSDVFISGAIINSSNGFNKKNNANTVLKGIFYSNKTYSDQWSYALAAYQPQFTYNVLADTGKVVSVNGTYRAGTPVPIISTVVNGGSGGGGNNYSGSSSSMDNFTACSATAAAVTQRTANTSEEPAVVQSPQANKEEGKILTASFSAFPNPAYNNITFLFVPRYSGVATISVTDIYGKTMLSWNNGMVEAGRKYQKNMDVQALAAGVYFIRYQNNKETIIQKIVIAK